MRREREVGREGVTEGVRLGNSSCDGDDVSDDSGHDDGGAEYNAGSSSHSGGCGDDDGD